MATGKAVAPLQLLAPPPTETLLAGVDAAPPAVEVDGGGGGGERGEEHAERQREKVTAQFRMVMSGRTRRRKGRAPRGGRRAGRKVAFSSDVVDADDDDVPAMSNAIQSTAEARRINARIR